MSTNTDKVLAVRRKTASIRYGGTLRTIKIKAEAYYCGGNRDPHFAITAEIWNPRRKDDCEACGCLHDEILKVWKDAEFFISMHLSDALTGEPMHGESNGYYQLAGACGGLSERYHAGNSDRQIYNPDGSFNRYGKPDLPDCLKSFAEYVRIPLDEAQRVVDEMKAVEKAARDSVATEIMVTDAARIEQDKAVRLACKAAWTPICDAMRPRWKREAEKAMEWLKAGDVEAVRGLLQETGVEA